MPVGVLIVVLDVAEVELGDEFDDFGAFVQDVDRLFLNTSATGRPRVVVDHDDTPPVPPLSVITESLSRLAFTCVPVRLTAFTPNFRLELGLLLDTGNQLHSGLPRTTEVARYCR